MQASNKFSHEQKSPSIEECHGLDAEEFPELGAKQPNKHVDEDPSKPDDKHSFELSNEELHGLLNSRDELVRHCFFLVDTLFF